LRLKNTTIDKVLTYASETATLTKRDRKQLNVSESKVYRRILGTVYDFFCFLDRAFSIMKTKINQQNAQINSGLIYY